MAALVEAVLRRALAQVGVREDLVGGRPGNTGRAVDAYLRSVGIHHPAPWCAAFVYWCVAEEARAAKLAEVPFLRSGYCPAIHADARARGLLETKPERGDAFLVLRQYPEGRFASHIGLVTSVDGWRFGTVEGNTNAGGSAEGDGVYTRSRPIDVNHIFVRWRRLLPAEPNQVAYRLVINGTTVADMPVVGGRSLCPLREWAGHWGLTIAWDADAQVVLLDGKPVAAPVSLIGGRSFAPISDLIQGTGLTSRVDVAAHRVELTGGLR